MSGFDTSEHALCSTQAKVIVEKMSAKHGIDVELSQTFPARIHASYPPEKFTCPHGTPFYIQPTAEAAASLDALEAERPGGD